MLVYLIRIIHLGILLFAVFGSLFPSSLIQIIHIILIPLMIIHWKYNQNTCFLTTLEYQLTGRAEKKEGGFIKAILGIFLNPIPSDALIKKIVYGTLFLSWGVSLIRLIFSA